MRTRATAALAILAGMATAANAAFISFASESGPGPTLQGAYQAGTTTITDFNNPPKVLRVAAENGGTMNRFERNITLTFTASLTEPTLVGDDVIFQLDNFSFELRDAANPDGATNLLFRFTSFGRNDSLFLGLGPRGNGGGGIVAASLVSDGQYQVGESIASELGLIGPTTLEGQASFALTGFDPGEVPFVYDGTQVSGLQEFTSMASFSGAFIVPTPGALALAGIAGLALTIRRR